MNNAPMGYQTTRRLFLFEGIAFIFLGILAIILPGISTLGIELMVGAVFLAGGIVQAYSTLRGGKEAGFWASLISAILYILVGLYLLAFPLQGMFTLTVLLIAFFLIEGIAKIVLALDLRPLQGWVWVAVSGVLAIFLAALIWSGWPSSALWAVGLIVGINMLFLGFSLLTFALANPRDQS